MSRERAIVLGLVQMSMGDDQGENLRKATGMVEEASRSGAKIVCLPELFTSRYFPQAENAKVEAEAVPGPTTRALASAAKKNKVAIVGGSISERAGGRLYNTSVVFDPNGRLLGKYRKVHIPQDVSFYEQTYFSSGGGYRVFRTGPAKVGVLICFDQWYPEAARAERLLGADVLFYPTAIGTVDGVDQTEGDWQAAWETVQRGHAISNGVVVAAANRVGREGGMRFWGGSFVCDQFGTVLARAGDKEQVLIASCDLDLGRDVEDGWGFLRNRKPRTYGRLVS